MDVSLRVCIINGSLVAAAIETVCKTTSYGSSQSNFYLLYEYIAI